MKLDYRVAQALDLVGDPGTETGINPQPIRNAPSPLGVFVPFIARRGVRRSQRLEAESNSAASPTTDSLSLKADQRWHQSDLVLHRGESVTLQARGRLFLSRVLEVSIGPQTCVWFRFGDGDIQRLPADQATVTADRDGPLHLQVTLPGAFGSPNGDISVENPPPQMSGEIQIDILREGHVQHPTLPVGWKYYWRLGEGSIFRHSDDYQSMCCKTHGDVGIIKHPVDCSLDQNWKLEWSWRVEQLPSQLPEHIQPTHDYLSIAVEFDNGLDLTYMWSSKLPVDTIFQCPLPWWDKRETHWVLRRPEDGLGQWLDESRNIRSDYLKAIGGALPKKVVAVWLIANSAFQCEPGVCEYRNIRLRSADSTATVFSP